MKALILAAGYATRLRPLTDEIPKMLLPLAERPMLDYLVDRLREVDELDEIHLVTNARFAEAFRDWAPEDVAVHDDGTTSNEDRLGAIGDIAFAIERGELEGEDLLIVAGDNLIGYSLADFVAFWRGKDGSAIAVREIGDRELLRQYGVVELDEDDRVVGLEEKPAEPKSDLAATASYALPRRAPRSPAALPRRRQPAGRARELHGLAAHARARLRLPRRGRMARHRRPRPAPRGRQHAAPARGLADSRGIFTELARFRHRSARTVARCCSTSSSRVAASSAAGTANRSVRACDRSLRRLTGTTCERCGAPTAWPVERCRECGGRRIAFASARAAVVYDDSAKRLVAAWKERGQRTLAAVAAEIVDDVRRPRRARTR